MPQSVHWGNSLAHLKGKSVDLLRRVLHLQRKGIQCARFKLKLNKGGPGKRPGGVANPCFCES
ncbi:hypothetical protein CO2235_210031 [Cupriavidus oxalaticus]|uniref:Uncharacterized protein n=1 Tax=Cupriavidus oxalaticus TaxID=96344 RepID=A0A976BCY4_9BURK|nr:hypothetical protein CO2235_210031 [Cupriavidus oxalaticus]